MRHGQTPTTGKVLPGRAPGLHLADKGVLQAEAVAARIAALQGPKRRVAAVYASPLERTQETASPIAKALGLRVRRAKGLLECDFGDWTGAELKKLSKLPEWRTVQRNPSGFRFPGGESFVEMQTRIGGALAGIRADHPGETVVAVSLAGSDRWALLSPGSRTVPYTDAGWVEYEAERNAIRSRSRSTTRRVATDCTRPAERPARTLRHSTGDTS